MPKNLIYKNLILNEDEDIAKLVRQPAAKLVTSLVLPIGLIVMAFFFLYPLFSLGNIGMTIFLALILISLIWLVRNIITWYWQVFIITSQRIIDIDQKGIFQKVVSDIPLTKIEDVFYKIKGFWQTVTRIGTVSVILDDNKTKIKIENIAQPRKIQQLILRLKADTLKEKMDSTNLSAQELIGMIKKIKAVIGEEKFQKIISESDDN